MVDAPEPATIDIVSNGTRSGTAEPRLSIVVPCCNEEPNIGTLHARVGAATSSLGYRTELVLVDDGSSDQTWARIQAVAALDPTVLAVKLSRNHGHQLALTAGLSVCTGDRVLILDADLQDPPELLPQMMARMDEGFDVVYGQRIARHGESALKRSTAHVFYRMLQRLVDTPIPVDTGDFRLMSRRAVNALHAMPERHRFVRGMVSWIGFPQTALPYERGPRAAGDTKYPLRKSLHFGIDAVTSFSIVPLRVASYLGLLAAALALVVTAYALWSWGAGRTVQGWTSLIIITLLLGGAQLCVLGVIGEYLGRLYMESKRRPLFLIEEIVRGAKDRAIPEHA